MDNVICIGTEPKLTDCSYDIQDTYIGYISRVECVYCKFLSMVPHFIFLLRALDRYGFVMTDTCTTGDLRLVDGDSEMEGRVEVCNNRRWGTVCDNQWTINNTTVVCRYLGFSDLLVGQSLYRYHEYFSLIV